MKVAFIVLATWALLGSSPSPLTASDSKLLRGLEVYRESYCGTCHILSTAHTHGTFGPPHDHLLATVERRFADGSYQGSAETVAAYLRESILDPEAYLVPAYAGSRYRMPAFTDLSPEDIDALIALLEQP